MGLITAVTGALGLSSVTRVNFVVNGNTVIALDASLKELHGKEATATEFPIENGLVVSDHMIQRPTKLEITGIISDTPIGGVQGLVTQAATTVASALLPPVGVVAASAGLALFNAISKSKSPSVAAYQQLLSLVNTATPVNVITALARYPSMWIEKVSVPREADTGQILLFTVNLIQLTLVTPQTVNIAIFANPGLAANKADNGETAGLVSGFPPGRVAGNAVVGGSPISP